jgi:endonuclease/exonuclease/phosphatase family metal-dependent hydrolase
VHGGALTFPTHAPVKRIDAIFGSPELRPEPVTIEVSAADLHAATDHLPLAVDVHPGTADTGHDAC